MILIKKKDAADDDDGDILTIDFRRNFFAQCVSRSAILYCFPEAAMDLSLILSSFKKPRFTIDSDLEQILHHWNDFPQNQE